MRKYNVTTTRYVDIQQMAYLYAGRTWNHLGFRWIRGVHAQSSLRLIDEDLR